MVATDLKPHDRAPLANQPTHRTARQQPDPRGLPDQLAQHWIEPLASDVVTEQAIAGGILGRHFSRPAVARPDIDAVANSSGLLDKQVQADGFQNRRRRGLNKVRAQVLEGARLALLLDDGHVQAQLCIQARGGAPCQAGANHDYIKIIGVLLADRRLLGLGARHGCLR